MVGFNKMPGLDVYHAADRCFVAEAARRRSPFYRLTPSYRHFSAYERAVFAPLSGVEIMLLSVGEKQLFQRYYHTPSERFHLLPPGIDPSRHHGSGSAEMGWAQGVMEDMVVEMRPRS